MHSLSAPKPHVNSLGRRSILKSAAAIAASTLVDKSFAHSRTEPSYSNPNAAWPPQEKTSAAGGESRTPQFHRKMVGFMLAHEQFPVPQLLELAVTAEHAGFDLLATSDHLQPWQANEGHAGEAWVTMGAIGQRTRRVWIGPTVTCPTFRYNPAVVAEAFATLSLLTPGRIFLGIGSGEALNEQAAIGQWQKWDERSERFIEAAEIIRKLWTGVQVGHDGKFYRVDARLYDKPAEKIPLLMAANGPKAMRRAGQHADGLITDPKTWKQHKSEFEAGAKAAGKDAAKMPVLVEQYVVVGGQQEAQTAAQFWRFGPKAFKKYYDVRDPEEIQRQANSEIPLDQVTEGWPISTDPAPHIKTVNELFASGASIVNIHSGQPDQKKVVEFYGKEVIPKVSRG